MSTLDNLQTAAHQVSSDFDSPINTLGRLTSDTDDAVEQAVGFGHEASAQVLAGPAKTALDEAAQFCQQVQEKLKEYIDHVEQAKGGG
ncbi:MAG: hypothetical protein J2P24_11590 [Streptosporangiales bacterium]|nr:hypothetical protein [Streptosporangiales bacterium]MBO0890601.1 hypothetical protein [Acidothermales bacterium]